MCGVFLIFLANIISRMLVYIVVSLCRGLVDLMWKISGDAGKIGTDGLPACRVVSK